ncbi:MAG TPA: LacI family DNA-binding transcriptional regulator, partial [Pseudolysinimonas sp.]|nr:LacI family DNA-binding transcriptional regulator [Pseudolysinimonas sp.]
MSAGKAVLLKDVASVAGVSASIASQVLNGRGRVSPETRARILAAAERLDFRPNALAQSFKHGRSLTVGLLVEEAQRLFTMPVVIGATTALGLRDMATLSYDASAGPERRQEIISMLKARRVDGVLVIGDGTERTYASLAGQLSVPVVYAHGESDNPSDTSFLPDAIGAGRLAAEHLIGLGRTRIAHVTSGHDRDAANRAT